MGGVFDQRFAQDTREHLDELERLLAAPGRPDTDHLLRLAGNVFTSARRAGAETVANVAARLEDAARSILTGNVVWSDEIRSLSAQTVADLKLLVRALNRWGPDEERRVREAIERWDDHDAAARPAEGAAVPIEALFHDDLGPHILEEGGSEPVPIEDLLLRGDAALREAVALRPRLEAIARGDAPPDRPLAELVDELFDLLELAAARGE